MTSLHQNSSSRLVDFFIDRDGRTYGDEHERLRYYEAHSVMLQLTMILTNVTAAVSVLIWRTSAAISAVTAVALIPQLSGLIGTAHLKRAGVRTHELSRRSMKRSPMWLAIGSFILLVVALTVAKATSANDGTDWRFAVAGVSLTTGFVGGLVLATRKVNTAKTGPSTNADVD